MPLRSTLAFEYPTVEELTDYLLTAGLAERLAAASHQSSGVRSPVKPSSVPAESVELAESDPSVPVEPEGAHPGEESVEAKLRRLEALLKGREDGGTYRTRAD